MQDFISKGIKHTPKSVSIFIRQDSNAHIGRKEVIDNREIEEKSIEKFVLDRIDNKR